MNHFEKLGIRSLRLVLWHCGWLTERDISQLADSGVSAIDNPLSTLKSDSGQMTVRCFLSAGVSVA